jgi:hypothetical protein
MTKTTWQHSPGSNQHWLYAGSSIEASRVVGMIYKRNHASFAVYRENYYSSRPSSTWHSREFLAEMPTLDEAKDLLVTITASQNI